MLKIVDGLTLLPEHRALLKPGEAVVDLYGNTHFLPRFFYEVPSWEVARATPVSEHFTLAELMSVDSREASLLLNTFPHYVPCAISVLARYLEDFRSKVAAPVYISTNGGYRSPSHRLTKVVGTHTWGTAANIYRVGDTYVDNQKEIERFGAVARSVAPEVFVMRFGYGRDETDDHLHIDIGYVSFVPRDRTEAR